jgi:hypothetical protein
LFDGERFAAIAREVAKPLEGGGAGGIGTHAGRDVFVDARLDVERELVVEVAFGARAKEAQLAAPPRLQARRHFAQAGRSAEVMTVVTALVKLDQVEASLARASRPLAVIS